MKKAFILALILLLPSYPVHAVDIKKAASTLLKCSWHLTKIGGGLFCISNSYTWLGIGAIMQGMPYVTKREIPYEDGVLLTVCLKKATEQIKLLNPQFTQDFVIEQILHQARTNKGDNTITFDKLTNDEIRTAANELRSSSRNKALLASLGLFAAGSSSLWSGAKGLYDEIKSLRATESDTIECDTADTQECE